MDTHGSREDIGSGYGASELEIFSKIETNKLKETLNGKFKMKYLDEAQSTTTKNTSYFGHEMDFTLVHMRSNEGRHGNLLLYPSVSKKLRG